MTSPAATRVQLCGTLSARLDGREVQGLLPGRQGRLLFVYLVVNRSRDSHRDELLASLWPETPPAAPEAALRALLSKLRGVVGDGVLVGRGNVRIRLPDGAVVDIEAARAAIHRAESALARSDAAAAWGPAQVALFTSRRRFLAGEDELPWVAECRRDLDELHLRALHAYGCACLRIAGTELPAAERAGRELARISPYRESGHRLLIEALAEQGNFAEALLTYERLRDLLHTQLGIAPSAELRELHTRLLSAA